MLDLVKSVVLASGILFAWALVSPVSHAQEDSGFDGKLAGHITPVVGAHSGSGPNTIISLRMNDVRLEEAVNQIAREGDLRIAYGEGTFVEDRTHDFEFRSVTAVEALRTVLNGSGLELHMTGSGHAIVTREHDEAHPEEGARSTGPSSKLLNSRTPQEQVQGRVLDGSTYEPLPGVNVFVKGTTIGTATGEEGRYTLTVPALTDTLVFSFVGYTTLEIPIAGRTQIDVQLMPLVIMGEEIVVVGYGTQRIRDVTGSLSHVGAEEFEDRPVFQLGSALQGKTAGIEVMRPSGKPQVGFSIRVRGSTSINASSEPLYIVDGVPTSNTYALNPSDIENITVLKDASAAAIYGASGANGVVLITTKRGQGLPRPSLNINSYAGVTTVSKKMDVLNRDQYIDLMTELGLTANWEQYQADTDWHEKVFRSAPMQNHQISLAGSGPRTNYYISGAFTKRDGVVRRNTADRYNAKINLDQQVLEPIKVGTSIQWSRWHDIDITDNIGAGRQGVILGVASTPPVIGIMNPDGTYTGNPLQTSWENPVASTDAPSQHYYNNRLLGNVYLEAEAGRVTFRSMLALDSQDGEFRYFLDPFRTDWGRVNEGIATSSRDQSQYWMSENTVRYDGNVGRHNLGGLMGFIVSKREQQSLSVTTRGFASAAVPTVNAGSNIDGISASRAERSNVAFIGRANYDYLDKYLLTVNFRADASSVFGPGNRWGYFPSISAGWRLSEESFMPQLPSVNDLKLRFGWGEVGNDRISEYAWYGRVNTGANYPIGGSIQPGTRPSSMENRDLRWERTTQTNLGLDVSLFGYRAQLTADAYLKTTSDLLFNKPVPTSTGFSTVTQNIGTIRNKGIEFQLSTINTTGRFGWETDVSFSMNRNRIIDLDGEVVHTGNIPQRGNVSIAQEGKPLGQFWGYIAEGVDPQTGMMIYRDLDGVEGLSADDKTFIGDPNPDFIYGLTNNFTIGNFGLNVFIQGVYGNDVFNASRLESEAMTDFKNQYSSVLDRWREPGQVTDIPRSGFGDRYNSELSTRFVEDGSYIRLKAVTLSYNVPPSLLNNLASSLRLYVTGENLLTLTNYSGYDPEVNAFGNNSVAQGIDYGTYPQTRTFSVGVNLSF